MADDDIRIGFITAEEEALKAKLSNITLPSPSGPVKAKAWFRMPEKERERTYPAIIISLIDIVFAADRAHSAQMTEVDYWPSVAPTFAAYAQMMGIDFDNAVDSAQAMWWLPYDLIFQVSTYCRSNAQDRAITAKLMGTAYLPDRFGYLQVPADNTERHLIRTGFASADYMEGAGEAARRLFVKNYNITVTADFPAEDPLIYRRVLEVHGMLHETGDTGISTTWVNPEP